jgi:hypothetical protein
VRYNDTRYRLEDSKESVILNVGFERWGKYDTTVPIIKPSALPLRQH